MKIKEMSKTTPELRRETEQYLEDRQDEVFTFTELQGILGDGRPRHVLAHILRDVHRYEVGSHHYLYGSAAAIKNLKEHLRGANI